MIKFFSNLFGRGTQVKTETVDEANTALRVGSLFEDLSKATAMKWDPDGSYEAGQVVYFNALRTECVMDASAGQSPLTHPLKWSVKAVTTKEQVTIGNNLLVTAAAVRQALDAIVLGTFSAPNATPSQRGLARQATDLENDEGIVNDAYTTPKQVHDQIAALVAGGLTIALQRVLETGNAANINIELLGANFITQRIAGQAFSGLGGRDIDGSVLYGFGPNLANQLVFNLLGVELIQMTLAQFTLYSKVLAAVETHAVFQQVSTALLPVSSNPTSITVWEYDAIKGRYTLKGYSPNDLINKLLLPLLDKVALANMIRPLLTGEPIPNSYRVTDKRWCEIVPDEPVPSPDFLVLITAGMIGTPQPHPFNRYGDLIWADLKNYYNQADNVMELTFPDPNHYLISFPPGVSDYTSGKLLLKPI